ncbi:MAG: hypothetical protein PHS95_02285 [Candidatus Pacebacteria bacterium]|nr:hypothetical protein [Candidatus Paceibacterota bacterium]
MNEKEPYYRTNCGILASMLQNRRVPDPENRVHLAKVELDSAVRDSKLSHEVRMELEHLLERAMALSGG